MTFTAYALRYSSVQSTSALPSSSFAPTSAPTFARPTATAPTITGDARRSVPAALDALAGAALAIVLVRAAI
jgi:hypothetical protein